MRLPDFLIIGAQKCGTSWLHRMLRSHRRVYLPEDKDDEFFSCLPHKPLVDYARRFTAAPAEVLIGDACASYFWTGAEDPAPVGFNPEIPRTVQQSLGGRIKLIVLVKDPVERAVSAYLHHVTHRSLDCNISITEAPDRLGLIAMSRYGRHLENWLHYYSADRFLVLPAVGSATAREVIDTVCAFLGIEPLLDSSGVEQYVFPGLRRLSLDDGIWVEVGQSGIESVDMVRRPVPTMVRDGKTYIRLVAADELGLVKKRLEADTAHFAELVRRYFWDHRAFHAWRTWPATG